MAEPLRPTPASTYGKENWVFVPTIASGTLAPTVAEISGASALDITNILFADTGKPSQSTNRVTAERRLGDTVLAEFIGATTLTGGELHYQHDPQSAAASNGKKAYEKFTAAGTTGYLVQRQGTAKATAYAAGQFVNVYPAQIGPSFPSDAGDAESGEAGMVATFAITSVTPAINIAILA